MIDKLLPGEGLTKPVPRSQMEPTNKHNIIKTATIPVSGISDAKQKPTPPPVQKPIKPKQDKPKMDIKTDVDKNIEADSKQDKPSIISEHIKEPGKLKTDKLKSEPKPKKVESKALSRATEKKPIKSSSVEKKDSVKSSPTTPKKSIESKVNGVATKTEIVKSTAKPTNRTKTSPSATPAKSAKEENNRKVVESKVKSAYASKSAGKPPKRDESVSKAKPEKNTTKRTSSSSPAKQPAKSISPVKAVTRPVTKGKKDTKTVKGENEKGIVTDSSAVSTPSTVDAETAIKDEIKVVGEENTVENLKDIEIESGNKIENKDIEENTGKEEIEIIATKENLDEKSMGDEGVSDQKVEEAPLEVSEREEEEDEILIIEKVEIEQYGEDSVHDQESLESHIPDEVEDEIQKHLRDEAESEKKKDDLTNTEEVQDKEDKSLPLVVDKDSSEENKVDVDPTESDIPPCDLTLNLNKDLVAEKVLTPEDREQIEEEVQEIITSATDFVAKAKLEQSKESSELSAEGVGSDEQKTSGETKDLLSSPDKQNISSDKVLTDEYNKLEDTKDKSKELGDARYGAEESQPDEKFSTTVESGATTAPTLPEDERIPLDDIKEGVEEKYDKEETKENDTGIVHTKLEQPTTLPQVSVVPGGAFETQATMLARDIVKTPDEVADLPVHEEVDGLYEHDFVSREVAKGKEDLLSVNSGKRETGINEDEKADSEKVRKDVPDNDKDICHEKEVPKDVKADEDELKELTLIRQRLEQEDAKLVESDETVGQINVGKTVVDELVGEKEVELPVGDMVVEEELVHSTLRTPEKAELVVVTPDSAPDSPLHLLSHAKAGEKTTAEDKSPNVKVEDTGKDVKESENEPNVGSDMTTDQVELDKKELHPDITVSIQSNQLDNDGEICIDDDKELKGKVSTPKTPPATPILCEFDQSMDKFEIIHETSEHLESSVVNIDELNISFINERLEETKVGNVEETVGDCLVEDHVKELNVQETTPQSIGIENLTSISPTITEQVHDETNEVKVDTPKSISPVPTAKKDSITPILDDKETDKIPSTSVSPVPNEEDEGKEILQSSKTTSPTPSEIKETVNELSQGDIEKQKLSVSKPVSPASSVKDETESNVLYDDKLGTPKTASPDVQGEMISNQALDEKLDTPKSISPVQNEHEDNKQIKTVETDKGHGEKSDSVKSISPLFDQKDDSQLFEDVKHAKLEENQSNLKSTSSIPDNKEDSKMTNELQENVLTDDHGQIGNVDGNVLDSSKLGDEKQDIQKPVSPTLPEKNEQTNVDNLEPSTLEDSKLASPSTVSIVPGEHEEKKYSGNEYIDHPQEKHDSKSSSPVPFEEDIKSFAKSKETHIDEHISFKSSSDMKLPTEMEPLGETHIHPESTSPKEIIKSQDKIDSATPKSVSPVPTTDKIEDIRTTSQTQATDSATLVEKESKKNAVEEKICQIQEKEVSPKSVSPAFSDKDQNDILFEDKSQHVSGNITPKSSSPILSDKVCGDIKQEKLSLLDNTIIDTLSSVVSDKSEKQDSETEIVEPLKEKESPKSLSPDRVSEKDKIELMEEKLDTPKCISPVLSEKTESPIPPNDEGTKLHDKKVDTSPKSLSPIPSEKGEETISSVGEPEEPSTLQDETIKLPDGKLDSSPKSSSPIPSEREEETKSLVGEPEESSLLQKEEISKLQDGKFDASPKSASPILGGKEEETKTFEEPEGSLLLQREEISTLHDGKLDSSPKSLSPIPIEKEEETKSSVIEPEETPMTDKGEISKLQDGKLDMSPKSASPTPGEKEEKTKSSFVEPEGSSLLSKEEITMLHDGKLDSSPKSISPIPGEKEEETKPFGESEELSLLQREEISKIHEGKLDSSPKSLSPTPSGKETKSSVREPEESSIVQKCEISDQQDGKLDTSPKSASPIPDEKEEETKSSLGKPEGSSLLQNTEITKLHDGKLDSSPKSLSPVPSEKEEETKSSVGEPEESLVQKDEITTLQEIVDSSPQSISPIPSAKEYEARPSVGETEKSLILQKVDVELGSSPKSVSPIPSEKGEESLLQVSKDSSILQKDEITKEHDGKISLSPKSVSPIPSEKGEESPLLRESKESSVLQTNEITKEHDGKLSPSPKSFSPIPSEKIEDKRDSIKSSIPLHTEDVGSDQFKTHDKCDTPKTISPVPSDISDTEIKRDTPKSISPVPSDKFDSKEINLDGSKIESKETTPKSISPVPSEKERSKQSEHESSTMLDSEKCDSSKSTSPAPSDKGKMFDDKEKTPQSTSPIPTDPSNTACLQNNYEKMSKDDKQSIDVSSKLSIVNTSLEKEIDSEIEKSDRPKSVSPVPIEKENAFKGKLDSSKSACPEPISKGHITTDEKIDLEKGDVDQISPKSVSPVLSERDDVKEISKKQLQDTTEKSEIESSEKQKGDDLCLSKTPVKSEDLGMDQTTSSSSKTLNDLNGTEKVVPLKTEDDMSDVEEKGILETLQSEKSSDSTRSSVDKVDDMKSGILTSHKEPSLEITGKVPASVIAQTSLTTNDLKESSSPESVLDIKHDTPTGSPEKSSSEKCDTSTASSVVSQQMPLLTNGHSDKTIIATSTEVVTQAVIEDKLASKDSKTVEFVKSESENIVPSKSVCSLTKPAHEADRALSSIDSGVSSITEAEKSDIGSKLPYESSDEHSSVSVHRMLVTGSSEDGGTEIELCSSSVTQMTSDTCDKKMGNVAHQSVDSESKTELLLEKSGQQSKSSGLDKTIITTHYTIDGKNEQEISSSGGVIKTITTTITKTTGNQPAEVITTESEVKVLKEETNVDSTKSPKSDIEFSIGVLSQSLKKEISDGRRSGTPASDVDKEFEAGGPSTPHSDISSGQVSRAATNVWGEDRPDSRHCDSDDDIPCSPMSTTSHIAQSPPQFDFDIHQHSKGEYYEDPKIKEFVPSAMTSSLYGSLPEEDPLDEYLRTQNVRSGESEMCSSMYISKYDNDDEEPVQPTPQGQFEAMFKSTKEDVDFETAIKEHVSTRGEDLTTKFTNGMKETIEKPETNGKSTYKEYSTNGHTNGKSSQPDSLEYQESQLPPSLASSSATTQKSVSNQPLSSEVEATLSSSSAKTTLEEKKDPIEGWGKPLGLPPPPKNLIDSPLSRSSLTLVWNPADEWGIPLGLPSPAPPPVKKDSMNGEMDRDITSTSNKTTPKKVARRNAENKSASNTPIGKLTLIVVQSYP